MLFYYILNINEEKRILEVQKLKKNNEDVANLLELQNVLGLFRVKKHV
jgi:hypothetical protein